MERCPNSCLNRCPQDANMCFVWSRMRAIDEGALSERIKVLQLSITDMLEALVRVASMKLMPTRDEWTDEGHLDGGDFLLQLRETPAAYTEFLARNEPHWKDPFRQPIWDCVSSLLTLIIRVVRREIGEVGMAPLTRVEVDRFRDVIPVKAAEASEVQSIEKQYTKRELATMRRYGTLPSQSVAVID